VPANLLVPLTGTPQVVPVDLPIPSFVNDADGLNPSLVLNDMVAAYELATSRTLYPAQVEQLLIDLYAYRETLIRNAIQACGVQNLLAFAAYPMLDYLGEYLNCPRLPAQPATTTILFTLSAAQVSATTIPQNSLVGTTDGHLRLLHHTGPCHPRGRLDGLRERRMHYGRLWRQRIPCQHHAAPGEHHSGQSAIGLDGWKYGHDGERK